jgi:hypothetical protein
VYSYHHNNTQKVAEVMAKVLDAENVTATFEFFCSWFSYDFSAKFTRLAV